MDWNASTDLGDDALATRGGRIAALLASDLAREAASEFDACREAGQDVPTASAQVIARFRDLLSSENEGPVILLALAALQLREGHLQPVILDAAIDLIESNEALRAFAAATADTRRLRKQLLAMFADDLREYGPASG